MSVVIIYGYIIIRAAMEGSTIKRKLTPNYYHGTPHPPCLAWLPLTPSLCVARDRVLANWYHTVQGILESEINYDDIVADVTAERKALDDAHTVC